MGLWNRLFGGGDEAEDSTNDYDENGKFIPGYWETPKGNLIKTRPVDNEGDD